MNRAWINASRKEILLNIIFDFIECFVFIVWVPMSWNYIIECLFLSPHTCRKISNHWTYLMFLVYGTSWTLRKADSNRKSNCLSDWFCHGLIFLNLIRRSWALFMYMIYCVYVTCTPSPTSHSMMHKSRIKYIAPYNYHKWNV